MDKMAGNVMDDHLLDVVVKVTNDIERKVDEAIDSLDNIEQVRARRLQQMRDEAKRRKEYLERGHGDYRDIEERDVFRVLRHSDRALLHFYTHESENCKVLDSHLHQLCTTHVECKFLKLDAEKSPYFVERLRIRVIPTCLIILNGTVTDRLVGFTELNDTANFTTECLEQALVRKALLLPREDPGEETSTVRHRTKFLPKCIGSCIRSADGKSAEDDW